MSSILHLVRVYFLSEKEKPKFYWMLHDEGIHLSIDNCDQCTSRSIGIYPKDVDINNQHKEYINGKEVIFELDDFPSWLNRYKNRIC